VSSGFQQHLASKKHVSRARGKRQRASSSPVSVLQFKFHLLVIRKPRCPIAYERRADQASQCGLEKHARTDHVRPLLETTSQSISQSVWRNPPPLHRLEPFFEVRAPRGRGMT